VAPRVTIAGGWCHSSSICRRYPEPRRADACAVRCVSPRSERTFPRGPRMSRGPRCRRIPRRCSQWAPCRPIARTTGSRQRARRLGGAHRIRAPLDPWAYAGRGGLTGRAPLQGQGGHVNSRISGGIGVLFRSARCTRTACAVPLPADPRAQSSCAWRAQSRPDGMDASRLSQRRQTCLATSGRA
jgi:hypothetical protein